ncbi:MAG TPA: transposase [Gammaproteobacteria bacterium]|nr:transposase [Gammaproteobacteria bacterium]
MELSRKQIENILTLLPQLKRHSDGKGRPPRDALEVLMGVLWILRTGALWKDMPDRYPPYQTSHRRYSQWVKQGVIDNIIKALVIVLNRRGKIDLNEALSWQSRTAKVCLSPYPLKMLAHMKLSS